MTTDYKRHPKHLLFSITLLFVVVLAGVQTLRADLFSVAFKTYNPSGNSPLVSGPEAAATAANSAFGAANVWNNLHFPYALTTNSSYSNLVDSTGAVTGAGFSITGTVGATDFWPWIPQSDPLRESVIFWNSWTSGGGAFGPGESTSITWALTGLTPNATYDMFIYGSYTDTNRYFNMTIQGTTLSIPTTNIFNSPPPPGVLFTNLVSDANGSISGLGAGVGSSLTAANEANWSGFQIVQINFANWKAGTGTWSNGSQWTPGTPGNNIDVTINSGVSNDVVTLDAGSSQVKSLTLGGPANGYSSQLTDGGTSQILTIGNALTVGQTGNLSLTGNGSLVTAGTIANSGIVTIGPGAALLLTNQPNGVTDVVAGSTFDLGGTFNAGVNNGFYQLTSVEGTLILENAQTTTTTPMGGTFTVGNTGYVEVKSGTTFNVSGNVVVNSGGILSVNDPFPTTVNITGTLTNLGGQVNVIGPNAFLNVGSVGNGGTLTLPEGSALNLANGFYQLASGTLGESIGLNGFAVVLVSGGLVALDGTLAVLLDPGFNPTVGSAYQFMTFTPGNLTGSFASIQNDIFNGGSEKWVLIYNNAGGYLELQAQPTPEPSSLFLLGSGLMAGMGVMRRKLMP